MKFMSVSDRITTLNRIRRLSRLMDSSIRIPLINFRIGLDPIIGLVPGAGDLITASFSAYLIYLATRFRLPPNVIKQMIFNVTLEAVVGGIPFIGDLFDAFYKSNLRNLALLEKHLQIAEPEISQTEFIANQKNLVKL